MRPTAGILFAGIGGFDLGFERAGFEIAWQVEIDPFCQKILAKNFPNAERFDDVRTFGAHNLRPVDVICGGFPCQDISNAGLRAGIEGARSGLWSEYARIIRELQPSFALVENVAALLGRGMGRVLGDLAEIGYDAEWEVVSAADVGAPHLRERVWILAYPAMCGRDATLTPDRISTSIGDGASWQARGCCSAPRALAHPTSERCGEARELRRNESAERTAGNGEDVSDTDGNDVQGQLAGVLDAQEWSEPGERPTGSRDAGSRGQWAVEPSVGRVAHGVPKRVDRLRGLGNAVVPQIPEMYARAIKELLDARESCI